MKRPTYWDCMDAIGYPRERYTYQGFLKSKYWWECKQMALKQRAACADCGCNHHLEVHHETYEHHGDELNHLDDLTVLCASCHGIRHGIIRTDRRAEAPGTVWSRILGASLHA